jgi:hypothetical protein
MQDNYRHFDGYRRPRRFGLIIALTIAAIGVLWIDLYDVPHGLTSLACDFHVTPWRGIITSPKFYWALPILLAETAFWIRLVIWVWPVPALAKPVFSDWILVVLILLLGVGITLYGFAALQPAPWNSCLK